MTEQEKMKNGYLWDDDEENMALQANAKRLVRQFNALPPENMDEQAALLPELFGEVGKNVLIGPNVTLCTTGHPVHPKHRADGMYSFPVAIGDNAWIGANVVVLPGGTIGENSVIGAGAVVTKDIPANVIAFGSPCKVYREINKHDEEYYFKDRRFDSQPENECMEDY